MSDINSRYEQTNVDKVEAMIKSHSEAIRNESYGRVGTVDCNIKEAVSRLTTNHRASVGTGHIDTVSVSR